MNMTINPADGYPYTPEDYAKFAGNQAQQAFQYFKDIDTAMRNNYATNIYNIGQNIYPLLYVESTFDGGRYTLALDANTRFVHQNVGNIYDMTKAVAHIPLGIFSIISGYEDYSENGQWLGALKIYRDQIQCVQDNISKVTPALTGFNRAAIIAIVEDSISYIDNIISHQKFNFSDFTVYARAQDSSIAICQTTAARDQVDVMTMVLKQWKSQIGDEAWDKMYVIIGAIWTLTEENAHELIIKALMKPELRDTHVVVSEAVPDFETAQTLMGRIVGDRIMAEMVFDAKADVAYAENIYSLSTRRDLLSQAVEEVLGKQDGGKKSPVSSASAVCPHLQR